jgi:hypothetical protein
MEDENIHIKQELNITESNKIDELVDSINKNIYNFHKVVHKLQQNYKTNKLNITKLINDNKTISEMVFNLSNNIDNKLDELNKTNEINKIQSEIKLLKIKEETENKKNEQILNDKFMYYFCVNIFATSIICLTFAKIF